MAKKEPRKIVLQVHGGLGANIMKTAVLKQLRAENPDAIIHVKASYPDVFKNLPEANEYFSGPPQQIIHGAYRNYKDFEFMGEQEPYLDLDYRQKKCHFIESACARLGLKKPSKNIGYINLTAKEKKESKKILDKLMEQMPNSKGKKIVAFQWTGGVPTFGQDALDQIGRVTQARNLPKETAQKIVDQLVKNDYAVLQLSLPKEDKLNGCIHLSQGDNPNPMPLRYLFAILNECFGFIGIDSFGQHAWAALEKDNGLVVWGGTAPSQLGYDSMLNLVPTNNPCDDVHCGRPFGFVGDFLGNGEPWSCPYDESCMKYNADFIVGKFTTLVAENEDKKKADKEKSEKTPGIELGENA